MARAPLGASSEAIRKTMFSNRSRNTRPELLLRRRLWTEGLRGYRLHVNTLPGKPDIVFGRCKLAIMVHGCWWHGCPHCGRYRIPRTNSDYWMAKLRRNQERDALSTTALKDLGFTVLIVWECQLKHGLEFIVESVKELCGTLRDARGG